MAQSAFVRVNQVGYVSGAAKRAYLMSSGVESGATFVIKNSSGSTVFGPAAVERILDRGARRIRTFMLGFRQLRYRRYVHHQRKRIDRGVLTNFQN